MFRSSLPEVFLRKGVLKIWSKFTGDYPCQRVISIKFQSNFIEITPRHGCSPVNLLHIFRTPFPNNISGGLLLYVQFYASKCTGLLLCSKQKHRKYLFFFKIFQKRVRWLRVNENKITNKMLLIGIIWE